MSGAIDTRDALGFTDVLFNIGLLVLLVLLVGQTRSVSGWDALGGRAGPRGADLTVHVRADEAGLALVVEPAAGGQVSGCSLARLEELALEPNVHCIRLVVDPTVAYGELHRLERSLRAVAVQASIPKQIQRVVRAGGTQ